VIEWHARRDSNSSLPVQLRKNQCYWRRCREQGYADPANRSTVNALAALVARPEVDPSRIAAIGFCFGGTLTYELALTGADIKAAIGFHSGLTVTSPADAEHIRAKVLALLGADDPSITAADRSAFEGMLRGRGVDWQMTLYGGVVHSFTNPNADKLGRPEFARYDANADARSWTQMNNLLAEVFRQQH
jgi:dienelactone hydrolase